MRECFTIQEVAEKLQVSQRTIWRWIGNGTMTAARFSKSVVRIHEDEIEKFFAQGKTVKTG